MYTALEIAKYIINKCIKLNRPVSNLQLQKILYYVQGEYMKQNNGNSLFEDDIVAWQYGPVVPEVYYNYNFYSSSDISNIQEEVKLLPKEISIIDPVIEEKSNLSAWRLVQSTHSEIPWKETYEEGRQKVISKKCLRKCFA
ncbi:DUF4065 domain-containing protein [Clostridium botulinum]|nr:DUF4065 domain-containing protein [Clostridium botulinum]